jgi:hypothetical protein
MARNKITPQAVGAYGEKMVEAALLRRGWIPSNVNASVRNAARFDIVAQRPEGQLAPIRVKTCGPGQEAFQCGFKPGPVPTQDLQARDFTVLVAMGDTFAGDRFYVLPTQVVRQDLETGRQAFYQRLKRTGEPRTETGQLTLWLRPLRNGEDDKQHDFARRWARYLDAWNLLSDTTEAAPQPT